jgi:hypothetical protein
MRLIDADELKELFAETITYIARKTNKVGALEHMIRASATVIQMIDDAPTVDAIPVIRCKDCKYYTGKWCTKYSTKQFDINDICKADDDFCSMAERKADADSKRENRSL